MDFSGRHVVVTGATGALGSAVVEALLAAGAHCRIPVRTGQDAATSRFRGRDRVSIVDECDVTDEKAVDVLYGGIQNLWASIHVAGGFAAGAFADTTAETYSGQLATNLTSAFLCSRAAVRAMRRHRQGGRIVNVAARAAVEWRTGAGMAVYTAAKAAVAAMSTAVAEEVAKDGILVNAVAPSIMDTPANRAAMPKANADAWPKVEAVAATILFLASPENTVTRGAIVPIYGKS